MHIYIYIIRMYTRARDAGRYRSWYYLPGAVACVSLCAAAADLGLLQSCSKQESTFHKKLLESREGPRQPNKNY